MMRFLFPGLTRGTPRGAALFDALVAEARQAHWYLVGKVPDTVDGRFAVLATVVALASVRLEHGGAGAQDTAVALTERFIHTMDSEHRQMGVSDPSIGKTVRKLVRSLERRIDLWRTALDDCDGWDGAAAQSLFREAAPPTDAAEHCGQHLRLFWTRLAARSDEELAEGRLQ